MLQDSWDIEKLLMQTDEGSAALEEGREINFFSNQSRKIIVNICVSELVKRSLNSLSLNYVAPILLYE